MHKIMIATMLVGGLAVAAGSAFAQSGTTPPQGASAEIRNAQGRVVGQMRASQQSGGLHVRITASGLPAGTYGAHLHSVGRCDPPDFASAAGHWNPTAHEHGSLNPRGPHTGDLPNLTVGANGAGALDFDIAGATLRGGSTPLLDADGAAIVIHAQADDYRTDPSGNSGARMACGVVR
jgi:Cu-Zn family superoxide dismutase